MQKISGILRFLFVLYVVLFTTKFVASLINQFAELNAMQIGMYVLGIISVFLVFGLMIYYNILQAQKEMEIKNYALDDKLRKLSVFGTAFLFSVVLMSVLNTNFKDIIGLISLFIIGFVVYRDAVAIPAFNRK